MLSSLAAVDTDTPARYAKQLLSHLGRKATVESVDDAPEGGRLVFAYGSATMRPADGQLFVEALAPDEEGLAHVEDVVARHLERFGARTGLQVRWQRP
jgi:hypothetical protein